MVFIRVYPIKPRIVREENQQLETLVTVIGMLLAFLTAIFAEPLRNRILDNQRKNNLRKALYKEMLYNHSHLYIYIKFPGLQENLPSLVRIVGPIQLITERYQQAKTSEAHLFYQLDEANEIHETYSHLFKALKRATIDPGNDGLNEGLITNELGNFVESVEKHFARGEFDRKIMREVMPEEEKNFVMDADQYRD